MSSAQLSISGVIFSMEGVILAFLEIKLSLHITMRTALNMSENATRSFWCQAVVSILSRSTCPNRFAIKHTQLYSPISTGVDRAELLLDPTIAAEFLRRDVLVSLRM